jgi:uncharacterized protein (UPF0335 family)
MSDTVGVAGDRIRSLVERIEQLEAEIRELTEGKKEVFAEAKGEGFDVKVLREISSSVSRTRASATSTKRCSTSTCAPWRKTCLRPSPKRHKAVHLDEVTYGRPRPRHSTWMGSCADQSSEPLRPFSPRTNSCKS